MESIVRLARVLSDPTRMRLLRDLQHGGSATSADLAHRLGLAPTRAAAALTVLRQAGLVSSEGEGHERTYMAETRVPPLLDAMAAAAVPPPDPNAPSPHAAREIRRNSPVRQARTCYDHLAGVAGVQLLDAMVQRGWLTAEGPRPLYCLTLDGGQALAERGVELPAPGRRAFAFGCMDWTERHPHLGGALGAAVLRAMIHRGLVRRHPGRRDVTLAPGWEAWLG